MSSFRDMLVAAAERRRAVGAFTCYGFEAVEASVRAAAAGTHDLIILISAGAYRASGGDRLLAMLRSAAELAPSRTLVQLDHVSDLDVIERALDQGVDAIMADGSQMPFEENVRFTARAVEVASTYGAGVEAELGHVAGEEDIAGAGQAGALTDPEEAQRLVEDSGVDALAVSIGNVHGRYTRPPRLDWDRLETIRSRVPVPIVLHGASGLADKDVRQAIGLGVSKINVNTELRERFMAAVARTLPAVSAGADVMRLSAATREAMQEVVAEKLELFGGAAPPTSSTRTRRTDST